MIRFSVSLDDEPGSTVTAAIVAQHGPGRRARDIPAFAQQPDDEPGLAGEQGTTVADTVESLEGALVAPGVAITVQRQIAGIDTLPFCFEIITPGENDTAGGSAFVSSALIRIVAAPGVSITLLPRGPNSPLVRIDIIRVQDPHCIPPLGDRIDASLLLMSNGVPMHRNSVAFFSSEPFTLFSNMGVARMPHGASREQLRQDIASRAREHMQNERIVIIPQRNGMLFFDNQSQRMLQVHVPSYTRQASAGATDHRARFSYRVIQASGAGPAVIISATDSVTVSQFRFTTFDAGESLALPPAEHLARLQAMQPFALVRVSSFDQIAFPGEDQFPEQSTRSDLLTTYDAFGPSPGWTLPGGERLVMTEIDFVELPPDFATFAGRMAADLLIARIPGFGDAIDLLELAYAASTGRDRWGQRVSVYDMALMSIGSLMPFVGSSELRSVIPAILAAGVAVPVTGMAVDYIAPSPDADPEEG